MTTVDNKFADTLTPEEVERYHDEGYLSPVRSTTLERTADLLEHYNTFNARGEAATDGILRSKPNLVFPGLYDLVRDPGAVTGPVSAILGPNLLAWSTSFFAKPSGDPSFISWHQDANYWGLEPHEILTAWIPFSPSHLENGCMRVIPGSHAEALEHCDTFNKDNLLTRGQEITVDVDESRATNITLQPDEMSLHHVGIIHGSDPNTSKIPRIGFAIRYIANHVRQTGGRTTATLARSEDTHGHSTWNRVRKLNTTLPHWCSARRRWPASTRCCSPGSRIPRWAK